MLKGFKEFISRGNAIDLAVGVVVGAAFGEVITTLVEQIINPLIGAIFGKPDFSDVWKFEIALVGDPAVISIGALITALINFLIVAFALYVCVIVPLNKLAARRAAGETETPEEMSPEVELLTQIRDQLATNGEEHSPVTTDR